MQISIAPELQARWPQTALGASPHDHRNAAEAMLRRLVKQAGLYHINNVVEVNNLLSISSGYAIGSYDLGQLQGPVVLDTPPDGTRYEGIGKGPSPSPTCPSSGTTWAGSATPAATAAGP